MKLGRRNLVYSIVLSGILLLLLVGYFIYMLPSLYVDYRMQENLRAIREQHDAYVRNRSYENVQVKNSSACYSVEIPKEGYSILIAGKAFSVEIIIKDDRVKALLERCREKLSSDSAFWEKEDAGGRPEDRDYAEVAEGISEELEELGEILWKAAEECPALPVDLKLVYLRDMGEAYFGESFRLHYYSGAPLVLEAGVSDADNHYTNYIAFEQTEGSLIMSYLPVITPEMDEIRPVVLQSLPMLGAVILLLSLLFSQVYSKGIVIPVEKLVKHAHEMKVSEDLPEERLFQGRSGRKDEIGELAETLDDFYLQIRESYRELEEENRRQEIFLRASSHQLKTPIAAALLLVDGMINQIGRYGDTRQYLPKVKRELLSMRKIVEDILYLNRCAENIQLSQVDVGKLLEERLTAYQIVLADKRITVDFEKDEILVAYTDETLLLQIVDNLLSNGVRYTPSGGHIRISLKGGRQAVIENFGVRIPEELLPHILEPFVSGSHERGEDQSRSHGLGLYIASYYARKLDILLSVSNGEDSVAAELIFPVPPGQIH